MTDRRTVIAKMPDVLNPPKYWAEGPLQERRQVDVGEASAPMQAWAEEGTYYLEQQDNNYKFVVHPDDFENRYLIP